MANKIKQAPRKSYKEDMTMAYRIGYSRGWDDAYDIPKRFGSRLVAGYGYQKGVRNRKRADAYTKQYTKR
jgi:hypothetical protein